MNVREWYVKLATPCGQSIEMPLIATCALAAIEGARKALKDKTKVTALESVEVWRIPRAPHDRL